MIVLGHWFGVFSKSGELDAVEESETMAQAAADNLDYLAGKPLNRTRTIRPILICEPEGGDIYKTEKVLLRRSEG